MAADGSGETNEVRLALERAAASWEQLTGEQRQTFIRALVRQVRYDGRSGNVTVQFDSEAFRETTAGEGADYIEAELNEIHPPC
jgi:hypothetical protein